MIPCEGGEDMTRLSAFGLFAVTAMLVCYAFEARSRWFIFAFAVACALASIYGFLQGAGRSDSLKPSGRSLPCAGGYWPGGEEPN
jgi:hypothetical protein